MTLPRESTVADLRALDHVRQYGDGSWWERWSDEDGETHWQRIGDTDAALLWLDFWRSVR